MGAYHTYVRTIVEKIQHVGKKEEIKEESFVMNYYEEMNEMIQMNAWLENMLTQETISSIGSDYKSVRYGVYSLKFGWLYVQSTRAHSFLMRVLICKNYEVFQQFLEMAPKRKYTSNEDYLKFGFTCIEFNGKVKPQCVTYAVVLSNEALKPAKLERHLKTMHPTISDKSAEYFQGKVMNLKKMKLGVDWGRICIIFESSNCIIIHLK